MVFVGSYEPLPYHSATGILSTHLQLIVEHLFAFDLGPSSTTAVLVPGGPLGFQIEVGGFGNRNQVWTLWQNLFAKLKSSSDIFMENDPYPYPYLCRYACGGRFYRGVRLYFRTSLSVRGLPFLFTCYYLEKGADVYDWRLLVTPLLEYDMSSDLSPGVVEVRPAEGLLSTYLLPIYKFLRGPNTQLVPGGPLDFQVEVGGFQTFPEGLYRLERLRLHVSQMGEVFSTSAKRGGACFPDGANVVHSDQFMISGKLPRVVYLPFVFSVYGPAEGGNFTDYRLLVTPLPEKRD